MLSHQPPVYMRTFSRTLLYLMPEELRCLALCSALPMQSVIEVVAVAVLVTACLQRC